jgi:hypothetical protein
MRVARAVAVTVLIPLATLPLLWNRAEHRPMGREGRQGIPIGKVEIIRAISNDDSIVIVFKPVQGAQDYWAYVVGKEGDKKAHGQETAIRPPVGGTLLWEKQLFDLGDVRTIELNAINRKCSVVVEALDKGAPYQPMLPMDPSQSMQATSAIPHGLDSTHGSRQEATVGHITNGHGPRDSEPTVIARSAPYEVSPKRRGVASMPTGSQRFYESWRSFPSLVKTGNNPRLKDSLFQGTGEYVEFETPRQKNGKSEWRLSYWGAMPQQMGSDGQPRGSYPLMMKDHAMWRLEDAGHVTNASAVLSLLAKNFDISKGKALHVTWEWNPFATSRNWHDLLITRAGDPVTNPGKLDTAPWNQPTLSGDAFKWEIQFSAHFGKVFRAGKPTEVVNIGWGPEGKHWRETARVFWDGGTPMANGTMLDVDKRHRYDLYLWKTGCQVEERDALGRLLNKARRTFPAGTELPFEKVQVHWVHQLYHTALRRQELSPRSSSMRLYSDFMQGFDINHSDNYAVEVLATPPS